jgi:hypothetical protein
LRIAISKRNSDEVNGQDAKSDTITFRVGRLEISAQLWRPGGLKEKLISIKILIKRLPMKLATTTLAILSATL